MTNVIRNAILSCKYKTSSANKLVDRKEKYIFVCFCAIRNTRKKVPANLSSWEKLRKLDAAKINTFTVTQRGMWIYEVFSFIPVLESFSGLFKDNTMNDIHDTHIIL